MIPLLMLVAVQAPPPFSGSEAERFAACAALVEKNAATAQIQADQWRAGGGGLPARQCLGMAFAAQEKWAAATAAFEQGAREGEMRRDGRAATLWVLAGNAALAGGEAAAARSHLARALALPVLDGPLRGEAHLDRARAHVALNDLPAARLDLDQALKLAPGDPMAWLLSATLARRQADTARAEKDIAEAVRLAPDNAPVAFEAGNVAALVGASEAAKTAWAQAAQAAPQSDAGRAAAAALARLATDAKFPLSGPERETP